VCDYAVVLNLVLVHGLFISVKIFGALSLKELLPPNSPFPFVNRFRHHDVEIGSRIFSLLQYWRELRVHLIEVQPFPHQPG
jgi:hypothetical protein